MSRIRCLVILFSLFWTEISCVTAPPYIHPCKEASDECITNAVRTAVPEFVKGAPELGVLPLDPFVIDQMKLTLPGGLSISLDNGVYTGMRTCFIEKATLIGTTFDMTTRCNFTVKGTYRANGRLLLFPINGHGDAQIKVTNIKLNVRVLTKNEIGSDKKYHVVLKNHKTTHEWGEKMVFHLSNLFDGSPEISNTVLNFLNNNWKLVAEEFGEPIINAIVKRVIANIKAFFASVPYEELIGTKPILS